jgi:hypothetical protein
VLGIDPWIPIVSVEAAAYFEAEAAAIVADAVSRVTVNVTVVPLRVAVAIVPVSGVALTEDNEALTFLPTHLVVPVTVAGTVAVPVIVVPLITVTVGDVKLLYLSIIYATIPISNRIPTTTTAPRINLVLVSIFLYYKGYNFMEKYIFNTFEYWPLIHHKCPPQPLTRLKSS